MACGLGVSVGLARRGGVLEFTCVAACSSPAGGRSASSCHPLHTGYLSDNFAAHFVGEYAVECPAHCGLVGAVCTLVFLQVHLLHLRPSLTHLCQQACLWRCTALGSCAAAACESGVLTQPAKMLWVRTRCDLSVSCNQTACVCTRIGVHLHACLLVTPTRPPACLPACLSTHPFAPPRPQ